MKSKIPKPNIMNTDNLSSYMYYIDYLFLYQNQEWGLMFSDASILVSHQEGTSKGSPPLHSRHSPKNTHKLKKAGINYVHKM